jgi:hypothetical protein
MAAVNPQRCEEYAAEIRGGVPKSVATPEYVADTP